MRPTEILQRLRGHARIIPPWIEKKLSGRRRILARLNYAFRRGLRSWFTVPPETILHTADLPIEFRDAIPLIERFGYRLRLRFLIRSIPVRSTVEHGDPRSVRWIFRLDSHGPLTALLLRFFRKAIRRRLEAVSRRILLYAWAGIAAGEDPESYDWTATEYISGSALRRRYAVLDPRRFPLPLAIPDRWFSGRAVFPGLIPNHVAAREHRMNARRARRVLILPFYAMAETLESILPPPFLLRRKTGDRQRQRLILRVYLDGGDVSERGSSVAPGDERWIYFELLTPVRIEGDRLRGRGWMPVLAARVPVNRPRLPYDPCTASYRIVRNGFHFCIGDRNRRAIAEALYYPRRGLKRGDRQAIGAGVPTRIFLFDPHTLRISVVEELWETPVNRQYAVEHARRKSSYTDEAGRLPPSMASYLSAQLGIPLQPGRWGWFLSYANVGTLTRTHIDPLECHYRHLEVQAPELADFARNRGDRAAP